MGNVISWADAVKALEEISKEQKLVSGMTVAEAAAALKYTKTASGMYLKTVITGGANSVAGATATEVASGATATATNTAVNLTLVESSSGTATVAGIGSVAIAIAATIAATVGGYLIGNQIYKNNSEFLDKLMFPIYDYITGNNVADTLYNDDNAPTIPIIYDSTGNTYLPSTAVSNVKTYLDDVTTNAPSAVDNTHIAYALSWLATHPAYKYYVIIFNTKSNYYSVLYASTTIYVIDYPGNDGYLIAKSQGVTDTVVYATYGSSTGKLDKINVSDHQLVINTVSGTMFSARIISSGESLYKGDTPYYVPPVEIPEGVTKYTPTLPSVLPITTPDGKTWSPVYLPSTSPVEMPDGEPVPATVPDPIRITPYLPPKQPQPIGVPIKAPVTPPANPIVLPNPEPDISTAPYPTPDPSNDPSQEPAPQPVTATDPIPPPVNTGTPVVPVVPPVVPPSAAKGLLHVYNPTAAQVDAFGEWLWTTFSGDLIDTLGKLFNNPMDAVIGLHEIYCTPTESGTDFNIRAGFLESNVPSRLVTSRYTEIKCGALSVPEYWGNYLDYAPYTKSYCYLPFIGIVELNTDDIVGSGIEITYRIDVYNGSCIALITTAKPNSDESVSYQFEGNCSVTVPITSGMMSSLQSALIGVATTGLGVGATAAVTVATGGMALPAAVMAGSVAAGATKQGITTKNQVSYSGSFGSSYGAMGIKKPFLIIKRPRQKVVYGYNKNYGYPAHKMVLISTCTGYLRAIEVDVISPTATEAEKKMIEQLLKSGVFVD